MKIQKIAVIMGSSVLLASGAMADQLGLNFTYPGGAGTYSVWTLGFEFQVTSPVTVTGLATFDPAGGLLQAVPVGLWAEGGALITSATVPVGSLPNTGGPFTQVGIAPITLAPGFYDVGSYDPSDDAWFGFGGPISTAPGITYVSDRFATAGLGFSYPDQSDFPGGYGWFGGDIVLGTGVPDAASSMMLLTGACTVLGALRRKLV